VTEAAAGFSVSAVQQGELPIEEKEDGLFLQEGMEEGEGLEGHGFFEGKKKIVGGYLSFVPLITRIETGFTKGGIFCPFFVLIKSGMAAIGSLFRVEEPAGGDVDGFHF
jgi:hypothetical protein